MALQHLQNSNANQTDVWFAKAGIKRTWTPLGATVLWGEAGQYHNMYNGLCGAPDEPSDQLQTSNSNTFCLTNLPTGKFNKDGTNVTQVPSSPARRSTVGASV